MRKRELVYYHGHLWAAHAMRAWGSALYLNPSGPSRRIEAKWICAQEVLSRPLVAGQQPPIPVNALAEAILKRIVLLTERPE